MNWLSAVDGAGKPWQRRATGLAIVAGVLAVHACVADHMAGRMSELGADAAMPQRVEVVYVRDMEISAPPRFAPAPPAAPALRKRRLAAAPAASAPASASSSPVERLAEATPEPPPPEPVVAEPAAPEAPTAAVAQASERAASAAMPSAAAASGPAFQWPASTRVSYTLSGNYRGEINGNAQVEWVRLGESRYQVRLDVTVGLDFAPLLTRKMTSEGQLTPAGLVPERYDEDSKVAFRDRRRSTIRFEPEGIVLPDGRRVDRRDGVQDAASQFVQLTYLFTTRPELLVPGNSVDIALALPRNVDRWIYDVVAQETLATPFGSVDAVHLKPRRVAAKGGDLTAEIWFAPSLAYLPVRIRIRQDAETFIDLVIQRKPQLATQ